MTTCFFLQILEGRFLETVALLFEEHTTREHDVAALLVELDDLELEGLAEKPVEVSDRTEVDLRARKEGLHSAANRHGEAALHALRDGAFDQLVTLTRGADLIPDLELVGFFLRETDEAILVLFGLDEDVDAFTRGRRNVPFGVDELV